MKIQRVLGYEPSLSWGGGIQELLEGRRGRRL